jgi:hypothetical protein
MVSEMSSGKLRFLSYLILLLISGQALASPFLVCPHMGMGVGMGMKVGMGVGIDKHAAHAMEGLQPSAAAMAEHCAGMALPVSTVEKPADHECDPGCQLLCLGAIAPALPTPALWPDAAAVPPGLSLVALTPPAQPREVAFRPPASA